MQLVIAEKPSVGVALAKALGVTDKKDGYIEGNGYIVSWCGTSCFPCQCRYVYEVSVS